jgi:antitoxin component YwqK of YwqJK toxin-antitoxin module
MLHGSFHVYSELGIPQVLCNYKHGLLDGKYYEKSSVLPDILHANFSNGKLDGPLEICQEGKVLVSCNFKENALTLPFNSIIIEEHEFTDKTSLRIKKGLLSSLILILTDGIPGH